MKCTAVLIDSQPAFLKPTTAAASLLTLPFGRGSVLAAMYTSLRNAGQDEYCVYPRFVPTPEYRAAIAESYGGTDTRLVTSLEELLTAAEPSDWFLLVDVSQTLHLPLDRGVTELHSRDPRCVTNFVTNRSPLAVREEVYASETEQIHRIQRFYDGVTELQDTRQAATLISAAALRQIPTVDLGELTKLRGVLARLVIPQNDCLYADASPAPDHAAGFLCNLQNHLKSGDWHAGEKHGCSFVGDGAVIERSARLHGVVVVQDGARIDRDARIVGPTVIGRGASIGAGAVVTHALIGPRAVVPPASRLDRCVFLAGMPVSGNGSLPVDLPGDQDGQGRSGTGPGDVTSNQPPSLYLVTKRIADVILAAAGLLVLSPLLLLVAGLLTLTSPGPVFYGDRREGRGGRVFRCWKFRTMVTGAAAQQRAMYNRNNLDGPQFKIENDTRITPLGKLLRATNIDELPQLFNVLRGEMSLVGPRPSPFRENQICVPWRQARLAVRPGITGLWQMCRHNRALGDFHQWIWYDLLYVRHLSARCDAAILLATLLTLGGRRSVSIAWFLPRSAREGGERSSRLPRRVPILEPPSSAGGLRLVATDQVETAGTDQTRDEFIARLNDIALRALPRMFIPDQRVFVHSLRRRGGLLVPTGQSLRYTAIVLIGLREMPSEDVQSVLRGEDPGEVLDYLLAALPRLTNLGDVAAIYWAACHWEHRRRDLARQRMAALLDFNCAHKTVDIAWCLSACCTEPTYSARSGALRYKLADLLMAAFQGKGNLFPYRIGPRLGLRGHVACFADQVYPIMALSLYHSTTRSPAALEIAARTAESICRQMGPGGQWWWHYDARNGEVIEKYPVYAVHQDAMAPMALHCLEEAGGPSHRFELERGLDWLRSAAELRGGSLVDDAAGVIWRKVGRREPRKLVRTMQSVASGAHAGWRIPGVDFALPPRSIDFECRPYHLGWFFVAFGRRMARGTPGERAKIA